jgi:O-acetyl-ADP-ribose deacetylase (regulator of RNase III)
MNNMERIFGVGHVGQKEYKIAIKHGDITKSTEDVIVNAAHESLMGGGGVDGAIHMAAGERLLMECRDIHQLEKDVRCRVGETVLTKAYNLKSKYIIHTVAPKFVGSIVNGKYKCIDPNLEGILKDCYRSIFRLADKVQVESIALPSLGTGGHSIPVEIGAPIAINTVFEMMIEGIWTSKVSNIVFYCFCKFDLDEYIKELAKHSSNIHDG